MTVVHSLDGRSGCCESHLKYFGRRFTILRTGKGSGPEN